MFQKGFALILSCIGYFGDDFVLPYLGKTLLAVTIKPAPEKNYYLPSNQADQAGGETSNDSNENGNKDVECNTLQGT